MSSSIDIVRKKKRRSKDRSVILPWEHAGSIFRRPGMSRIRPVLTIIAVALVFVLIAQREKNDSGIRATRASLLVLRSAVDAYRANNNGECPRELADLERKHFIKKVPLDAWGRPFLLTCPGLFDREGYELSSAGPDGIPGGLDRVE